MTTTAVVILNYNGEALLRKFLPSVIDYSSPAEIYVADNGSTDDSLLLLEKEFPSVKVIRLFENYGFCGGYNRALLEVKADYYILLNSDVEVTPNWITPLHELLDKDKKIAAVQPKILSFNKRKNFEYAGAGGGFIDSFGYPFCRGRIFDFVEEDNHQYDDTRPIFWATGACLMMRSELYHHFGGLDEDLFAHMEEIDLCWKLQRAGFKVYYCGLSTVYHLGAGTLGYGSTNKTYLNFRNGLTLITKHLDPFELVWKLPVRFALDWTAAFVFLINGQRLHSKAVLRAHRAYIRRFKSALRKREQLREMYPSYSRETIYPGLALWAYFVRRKTRLI